MYDVKRRQFWPELLATTCSSPATRGRRN